MRSLEASAIPWYTLAFLAAAVVAVYVTPLTIRIATVFGIHDAPDGRLKKHREPTPHLGGLAVACGLVITCALLGATDSIDHRRALAILAGGVIVLLLGLYDDLIDLRPSVKFMGQLLATLVLYTGGVHTELAVLGWGGNLLLTVLWVTGITNAFNIIDVMDGMATGVACVAVAFLFLISAAVADDPLVPFMSVALAGSLLGFLRFNFPPARIFLGDTGSLFVGFIIAALSMVVSYSRYNQIAIVTPVVLLAVPIFDTFFVAVHRARRGIPFFRGSPDHFALRLAHSGLGVRGTVLVSYCVGAALGCVSLLIVFGPARPAAWMVACVGAGALLAVPLLSCLAAPTFEEPKESGAARRSGAPART